jgi:hypothetical protein
MMDVRLRRIALGVAALAAVLIPALLWMEWQPVPTAPAAQEASPEPTSGDATPPARGRPDVVARGEPVVYVGNDGAELGRISVARVVDPFRRFPNAAQPEAGERYVVVELRVENTGAAPLAIDPNAFILRGVDGFLYRPDEFLQRALREEADRRGRRAATPVAATPTAGGEEPDVLAEGELAPGQARNGAIAFAVPEAAVLTHVLFAPTSDRLLILAELSSGRRSRE